MLARLRDGQVGLRPPHKLADQDRHRQKDDQGEQVLGLVHDEGEVRREEEEVEREEGGNGGHDAGGQPP